MKINHKNTNLRIKVDKIKTRIPVKVFGLKPTIALPMHMH